MRRILFVALLGLALIGAAAVAHAEDAAANAPTLAAARTKQVTAPAPARDRLQLDSTAVTGNRELPKVMSVVPWKAAEPAGGPDRPMGSLVEELLTPLDRDEFRREITYWRGPTPQSKPPTTFATPGANQR